VLEARLGVTAVLHTWTRALNFHPHVHCVVTAGGLSLDGTFTAGENRIPGGGVFMIPQMGTGGEPRQRV